MPLELTDTDKRWLRYFDNNKVWTLYDLSDHAGVHFQTARNHVSKLSRLGLVETLPETKGRALQYCAAGEEGTTKPVQFSNGNDYFTFDELLPGIWDSDKLATLPKEVMGAISFLALRSYYLSRDERTFVPGDFSVMTIRGIIEGAISSLETFLAFIKQLRDAKIWNEDDSSAWERLGSIDPDVLIEKGVWLRENWGA